MIGALVFEHAEKNQDWSYFESLYFSYTTLLTIGYGDFQPMSNSGKPFFVFWSLLAVPALTILISDMGDTVVKLVKDFTIWLGEITVLPSDDDTLGNRLKHGVYKATMGNLDLRNKKGDIENGDGDSDAGSSIREMPPGLTKIFRNGRHKPKESMRDRKAGDRLAADFEASEKREEDVAREKGEKWEEDEHHYRRVLISQIRRVYADAQAATPKKYTYEEWQYFLRLLGEREEDPSNHKKAHMHGEEEREVQEAELNNHIEKPGQLADQDRSTSRPRQGRAVGEESQMSKWSWIGAQSPLMGDKEEAEWLLERFFQRLEQNLSSLAQSTPAKKGEEYASSLDGSVSGLAKEDGSGGSERTMSRS
jgi:potassium channel subfamily K, other eukaryote